MERLQLSCARAVLFIRALLTGPSNCMAVARFANSLIEIVKLCASCIVVVGSELTGLTGQAFGK